MAARRDPAPLSLRLVTVNVAIPNSLRTRGSNHRGAEFARVWPSALRYHEQGRAGRRWRMASAHPQHGISGGRTRGDDGRMTGQRETSQPAAASCWSRMTRRCATGWRGIIEGWPGGTADRAPAARSARPCRLIADNAIDLLITDLNLPDGHGVQAIRLLRERQPDAEAMVISVLADDRTVIEAIEAGATGYLLKDSDPIDIVAAITRPAGRPLADLLDDRPHHRAPAGRPRGPPKPAHATPTPRTPSP